MGGAKKKSISQMEKAQSAKEKKEKKAKGQPGAGEKLFKVGFSYDEGKVMEAIGKMSVITPSALASQFNINLSAAKELLRDMERKNLLRQISGNSRLKIFSVVSP
jgi:ribosomal protein S25